MSLMGKYKICRTKQSRYNWIEYILYAFHEVPDSAFDIKLASPNAWAYGMRLQSVEQYFSVILVWFILNWIKLLG